MISLLSTPKLSLLLTIIFLAFNVLDGHSTYLVLKPNHYRREKNPVARWVFTWLGIPRGIIIFKTVLMSVLIIAIGYYAAWDPFVLNITMTLADVMFILVVLHNYRIARKYC
ncbi:MAG: DUF5658 family protein [Candidatus Cloacimonetes bacterium]|nr:DUF5658 family protein [Candidatus Cloacimonadota bacterium]